MNGKHRYKGKKMVDSLLTRSRKRVPILDAVPTSDSEEDDLESLSSDTGRVSPSLTPSPPIQRSSRQIATFIGNSRNRLKRVLEVVIPISEQRSRLSRYASMTPAERDREEAVENVNEIVDLDLKGPAYEDDLSVKVTLPVFEDERPKDSSPQIDERPMITRQTARVPAAVADRNRWVSRADDVDGSRAVEDNRPKRDFDHDSSFPRPPSIEFNSSEASSILTISDSDDDGDFSPGDDEDFSPDDSVNPQRSGNGERGHVDERDGACGNAGAGADAGGTAVANVEALDEKPSLGLSRSSASSPSHSANSPSIRQQVQPAHDTHRSPPQDNPKPNEVVKEEATGVTTPHGRQPQYAPHTLSRLASPLPQARRAIELAHQRDSSSRAQSTSSSSKTTSSSFNNIGYHPYQRPSKQTSALSSRIHAPRLVDALHEHGHLLDPALSSTPVVSRSTAGPSVPPRQNESQYQTHGHDSNVASLMIDEDVQVQDHGLEVGNSGSSQRKRLPLLSIDVAGTVVDATPSTASPLHTSCLAITGHAASSAVSGDPDARTSSKIPNSISPGTQANPVLSNTGDDTRRHVGRDSVATKRKMSWIDVDQDEDIQILAATVVLKKRPKTESNDPGMVSRLVLPAKGVTVKAVGEVMYQDRDAPVEPGSGGSQNMEESANTSTAARNKEDARSSSGSLGAANRVEARRSDLGNKEMSIGTGVLARKEQTVPSIQSDIQGTCARTDHLAHDSASGSATLNSVPHLARAINLVPSRSRVPLIGLRPIRHPYVNINHRLSASTRSAPESDNAFLRHLAQHHARTPQAVPTRPHPRTTNPARLLGYPETPAVVGMPSRLEAVLEAYGHITQRPRQGVSDFVRNIELWDRAIHPNIDTLLKDQAVEYPTTSMDYGTLVDPMSLRIKLREWRAESTVSGYKACILGGSKSDNQAMRKVLEDDIGAEIQHRYSPLLLQVLAARLDAEGRLGTVHRRTRIFSTDSMAGDRNIELGKFLRYCSDWPSIDCVAGWFTWKDKVVTYAYEFANKVLSLITTGPNAEEHREEIVTTFEQSLCRHLGLPADSVRVKFRQECPFATATEEGPLAIYLLERSLFGNNPYHPPERVLRSEKQLVSWLPNARRHHAQMLMDDHTCFQALNQKLQSFHKMMVRRGVHGN